MAEIGRKRFIHVIYLLGVVVNQEAQLAAVLEFCEFGSLKSYLLKNKWKFRLFSNYLLEKEMVSDVSNEFPVTLATVWFDF